MFNPDFLLTAKHVHPRVNSADDYRARQREAIDALRVQYPNLPWTLPHVVAPNPAAFVSGGRWLVECRCGNCPALAPEWGGLALCYECGAVYEGVDLPSEAIDIERLLVQRDQPSMRYWNPAITVEALREQNATLGIVEAA